MACTTIHDRVGDILRKILLFVIIKAVILDLALSDNCPGRQLPIKLTYSTVGPNSVNNPTVLPHSNLSLEFTCSSNHPTEWIYDWDEDDVSLSGRNKPSNWSHTVGIYTSFSNIMWADLHLQFDHMSFEEVLECRVICNHSNNIQVRLSPNVSTGQVYISTRRDVAVVPDKIRDTSSCPAVLRVVRTGGRYYTQCTRTEINDTATTTLFGKVAKFRACATSPNCTSAFRDIKLKPHCVQFLRSQTQKISFAGYYSWTPIPSVIKLPSVLVFEIGDERTRVAWEFFFSRGAENKTPELHFSLSEIDMRDLMWLDPSPRNEIETPLYYTTEIFKTSCYVSRYGLAELHLASVSLNGSRILALPEGPDWNAMKELNAWSSPPIVIEFAKYGPGSYQIDCSARAWNSTERVTRSTKIHVELGVEPHFKSKTEVVVLEDGEMNRRLKCDVLGTPKPNVSWGHVSLPGVRVEGDELILEQVFLSWNNYDPIKCTGTSRLGTATKEFKLFIAEKRARSEHADPIPMPDAETRTGTSLSTTTIIGLVAGLLCATFLGLGLFYFHRRLTRFSKAVADHLTSDEVNAFVYGTPNSRVSGAGARMDDVDQRLSVECLPYNSHLEVPDSEMFIDFKTELGSGHYGIVYKGQVRTTPVAVKTVRPNVPIEYFKALMSELKILAHIGSHEHIVNLVGANSSNIKNRQLYMGVELCKVSLLKHLRDNQPPTADVGGYVTPVGFRLEQETNFGDYANHETEVGFTAENLLRWTAEIATGMEFLVEKRIVHGDLAARNVLLSFNMRAKICDFGLARQLVDYSYVKSKSQKCELPWKWMAPESLAQMHFSTKSDVWAFGVTCWEIFSYGSVPYPCTQWTLEFVGQLAKGLRLPKPDFANDLIYGKMLECWRQDRRARPDFSELKQFFEERAAPAVETGF